MRAGTAVPSGNIGRSMDGQSLLPADDAVPSEAAAGLNAEIPSTSDGTNVPLLRSTGQTQELFAGWPDSGDPALTTVTLQPKKGRRGGAQRADRPKALSRFVDRSSLPFAPHWQLPGISDSSQAWPLVLAFKVFPCCQAEVNIFKASRKRHGPNH